MSVGAAADWAAGHRGYADRYGQRQAGTEGFAAAAEACLPEKNDSGEGSFRPWCFQTGDLGSMLGGGEATRLAG